MHRDMQVRCKECSKLTQFPLSRSQPDHEPLVPWIVNVLFVYILRYRVFLGTSFCPSMPEGNIDIPDQTPASDVHCECRVVNGVVVD